MAIDTLVLKPARMAIPASVDNDAEAISATLDRGNSTAISKTLQYSRATPAPCRNRPGTNIRSQPLQVACDSLGARELTDRMTLE